MEIELEESQCVEKKELGLTKINEETPQDVKTE